MGGLLVGGLSGTLVEVAVAVFAVLVADLVMLRVRCRSALDAFEVAMSAVSETADGSLVTGGTVRLEITVRNRSGRRETLEVVPLVPTGVRAAEDACAWLELQRDETVAAALRYRIGSVGTVVFPGVLLRRWSLLRLYRHAVLAVDRTEVTALPDFASSDHPVVARFLRADAPGGEMKRGRALKGQGSDFCELRPYLPHDPMRRVDWKATARRGRLLVREYEEPPEYTIRVILDGSRDLTEGESGREAFAHAADLVGKLAYVAALREMTMRLTVYDRTIVLTRKANGRGPSFRRLVDELAQMPRLARLRRLADRSDAETAAIAGESFSRIVSRWRPGEDLEGFLASYGELGPDAFLADFDPGSDALAADRCSRCGEALFADECGCGACGEGHVPGGLPGRAACLADVLARSLRESRGREMLVLVSAFRGGEAHPSTAGLLRLAATGYRSVHVVMPTHRALMDDRAEAPRSMGMYPTRSRTLRDIEALAGAETQRSFLDDIRAAGVSTHPIEDAAELEELVAKLLVSEVLAR